VDGIFHYVTQRLRGWQVVAQTTDGVRPSGAATSNILNKYV
jgi:hypothetical protein